MKPLLSALAATLLLAPLGSCSTIGADRSWPVDVTRFHLNQQVAKSTIAVEPAEAADANSAEFPVYRAAVARHLSRLGWTIVPASAQSEQIALVDVQQGSPEALAARLPAPVVPLARPRGSNALVSTLLRVSLRRRSEATVFWEGRAQTAGRVGTAQADSPAVVEKLAEALFRDFPGESGRTIRLP